MDITGFSMFVIGLCISSMVIYALISRFVNGGINTLRRINLILRLVPDALNKTSLDLLQREKMYMLSLMQGYEKYLRIISHVFVLNILVLIFLPSIEEPMIWEFLGYLVAFMNAAQFVFLVMFIKYNKLAVTIYNKYHLSHIG